MLEQRERLGRHYVEDVDRSLLLQDAGARRLQFQHPASSCVTLSMFQDRLQDIRLVHQRLNPSRLSTRPDMKYRFGIVDGLIECLHFKEPAQELFLCFRTGLLFGEDVSTIRTTTVSRRFVRKDVFGEIVAYSLGRCWSTVSLRSAPRAFRRTSTLPCLNDNVPHSHRRRPAPVINGRVGVPRSVRISTRRPN